VNYEIRMPTIALRSVLDSTAPNPAVAQAAAGLLPGPLPIALLGIPFDNVTLPDALDRISLMIDSQRPHYVVTANVDFLTQARSDSELRSVLLDADLVISDGMPIVWASRLLRNPLPERVAGADLVPQLITLAAQRGYRLFFLGGREEANQRAVTNARANFPGLAIVGHYSPPFRPLTALDDEAIIGQIRATKPDIVLVAFGCPKAEKWMARNYRALGVPVMIGVGATIDFLAGVLPRAPKWMQRNGLEWLFRLGLEPKRLCRRYVGDFWHFGIGLAEQWWHTGHRRGGRIGVVGACTVTFDGTWMRIRTPERLDFEAAHVSESVFAHIGQTHCLVDLSQTQFMDSTGVGFLLRLRKQCRKAGGDLVLLSPKPAIEGLLKSMRLPGCLLSISETTEVMASRTSDAGKTTNLELHPGREECRPSNSAAMPVGAVG
jgi:N-acetylglucosaminyldiphosphoundecaprenol N-acetyl-beta-D-mannosaminyltransferase